MLLVSVYPRRLIPTIELEGDAHGITSAQAHIRELADSQIEKYLRQPAELVGHLTVK